MGTSRLVLCAVAAAFATIASPAGAQGQSAPAAIRVAAMQISNFAPLLVAQQKGWFDEQNLKVTWSTVPQGALAVEAVFGGSAEFGGGGILEPMIARGNGLNISFVAANGRVRDTVPDASSLLVLASGPIRTPKDLEGKVVSAGLVNSINYVHMLEWLRKHNVNATTIQFLELPFPQMPDALAQKRLDAVFVGDPFRLAVVSSGTARILAYPYHENRPGMDITAFIAKDSWLHANADVARRFKVAIDKATDYLLKAPKAEVDDYIARYTGLKPDIAARSVFSQFTTHFDLPSFEYNLGLLVEHKIVKPYDIKKMIWVPLP
jgi:NitT/TauT family transport system substrate-binding protein